MKRRILAVLCMIMVVLVPIACAAAATDHDKLRLYPIRVDGKYGLINSAGTVITSPVLKMVYPSTEGLAAAQSAETEQWGYIDGSGTFVIPPQFAAAYRFREGLAAVEWSKGHDGYIDTTGQTVITLAPQQALGLDTEFRRGLAVVRERLPSGEWAAVFIDRSGQVAIRTVGQEAWNTDGDLLAFFTRGTRVVGFMDRSGTVVIEPIYRITGYPTPNIFSETVQAVCDNIVSKENTCGFIDRQGNVIGGFLFSWAEEFSEGMAVVGRNDLYGYVDATGTVVIEPQYEEAEKFSDGLAAVKVPGGLWGFIDKTGSMVIKPKYYGLKWGGPIEFHEGLAAVAFDIRFSTGYIDQQGNIIVPPVLSSSQNFSGGIAEIVPLKSSGLPYGYINRQGEYVWQLTPAPFVFAYQSEAVSRWVDTSRAEVFTDRDGQKVMSVWVKCVFDKADKDKIIQTFFKDQQIPQWLEKLAYFEEHYWFILSDAEYPGEKLPARMIVARLYYDDSGSGKTIDFNTYLYKGLNQMRSLYQPLSDGDKLILRLAIAAEPPNLRPSGIIKPPSTLHFKGTVRYIDLEGGFWGIVSDDGKHYDPINLATEYQQEGLRVAVEAVVSNRVGIRMWGTIVEIKAITKIIDQQQQGRV